jgi:hypothetical protein
MPLAILAAANAAVSAIQQGCELYKEYKGVVLEAKAAFDEAKENVDEVIGLWGFLKEKLFGVKLEPEPPPPLPKVINKENLGELSESQITHDLITNLKTFFNCLTALESKVAEAEEASMDVSHNVLDSALDIEYAMNEVKKLQTQIRETMVYQSPPELGDLYTRVVKRVGIIQEQQELARIEAAKVKKQRDYRAWLLKRQTTTELVWVGVVAIILMEVWAILMVLRVHQPLLW